LLAIATSAALIDRPGPDVSFPLILSLLPHFRYFLATTGDWGGRQTSESVRTIPSLVPCAELHARSHTLSHPQLPIHLPVLAAFDEKGSRVVGCARHLVISLSRHLPPLISPVNFPAPICLPSSPAFRSLRHASYLAPFHSCL